MIQNKINKLFKTVFQASQNMKGEEIVALDLAKVESYADYILLASGNSDRHIKAIADRVIEDSFKKCHAHPLGVEGLDSATWVLIDFGDVICHVFSSEVRAQYHLEDMWPEVRQQSEEDLMQVFIKKEKSPPLLSSPKRRSSTLLRKAELD